MSRDKPSSKDTAGRGGLDRDARRLQKAVTELARAYQFRDRTRVCCHDLSVTQFYALDALIRNGPSTLNMITAELYLNKSTVSRTVDSLESKGYVRCSTDPVDARALTIEITEQGEKLFLRIEEDLVGEMKTLISEFKSETRRATTQVVTRLTRAVVNRSR